MLAWITGIVFFVLAWCFILVPPIVYLLTAWRARHDHLMACFSDEAIKMYSKKFFGIDAGSETNFRERFSREFHRTFGRRHYIVPLVFLGLISGVGLALVINVLLFWLNMKPECINIPPLAVSAFLGAYSWITYDQLNRFRVRDYTRHDLYFYSYRFLLAVPLGWFIASIFDPHFKLLVAFFLGSFPTTTLFKIGRRFINQKMGQTLGVSSISDENGTKSELEQLQGINRPEAERFADEGITNNLQLAYCNPIQITIRTNFDFEYVIDCISQALLWLYIGKHAGSNMEKLRLLGLRGAHEACALYFMLHSDREDVRKMATANLKEIVKILGTSEEAFEKTLVEVSEDPYTQFVFSTFGCAMK